MIYTVYVLKCEGDKYYVGKSMSVNYRLDQHFNEGGSSWTKKYKPVKVLALIYGCDKFDEDKYTLKYMEKFGIDNVRGGSWSKVVLTDNDKKQITQQLRGANDLCFNCGSYGHFASECDYDYEPPQVCYRCGRTGHVIEGCFARKHIDGYILTYWNEPCQRCGRRDHWKWRCFAERDAFGNKIE